MSPSLGKLGLASLLILIGLSSAISHAQTQTLFFQPPSYTATGETVSADLNQDGKPDLVSLDGTVLLGNGDGTFRTGTPLTLNGIHPTIIAIADFNGDGKPDVLLMVAGETVVYVLLGKGDGSFQPAVGTNIGTTLAVISATDVNGDGKADALAIGPLGHATVLWEFRGNGDGTFAAGVQISNAAPDPGGPLLPGDFNGDGKPDIAIGSHDNNGAVVEVFVGNGNGTFQSPVITSLSGLFGGTVFVPGDFNGDHKLDLVVEVSGVLGSEAVTLLGNGDGTFQPPVVAIPASQFVYGSSFHGSIAAASDVSGSGKDDLVVQEDIFPLIEIFMSNGDGTFTAGESYFEYGPTSASILMADLNGDHKPDLAAMGNVLIGNGDGTFQGNGAAYAGTAFRVSRGMPGTIGDFNGDGSPDLATLADKLYIFLNDGTGNISLANTYTLNQFSAGLTLATADLNGDGKLDLVTMTSGGNGFLLYTLLGNGDGSFGPANLFFDGTGSPLNAYLALADFSGDHKPDLAVLSNGQLAVFMNNGSGAFEAPTYYFGGADPTSFVTGDFNNDGKIDVVDVSSAGIGLLLGNGNGTFKPAVFSNSGIFYAVRAAADLDHDGNTDLIAATYANQYHLSILLGKGDGTFTVLPPTSLPDDIYSTSTDVADLNGDGILDLVSGFGAGGPARVYVVLGNGDGTFGNPIPIISSKNVATGFTLVADLNHDSKPDLIVNLDNAVVTFLNTTPPGFTISAKDLSPSSVPPGASATSTITITPTNGFNATVTLSCSSIVLNGSAATTAPPTCSFSPATVSNSSGTSTLTVSTAASSALLTSPAIRRSGLFYALWLPLGGVALIGAGFSSASSRKRLLGVLLVGLMLSGLLSLGACGGSRNGGGRGGSRTPAGTYTITVKGTAGPITKITTLTLTVQ